MNKKTAFFDSKPYDRRSFERVNEDFGFDITYFETRLNTDSAALARGFDSVIAFVNDDLSSEVLDLLVSYGIRIVALRSAGYNNVDLESAWERIHIVRVPAYSPHAVAEHAVALMLSLNRNIHRAFYRTRDNNFSINGFLGFDMKGKTAGIIGTGKIGLSLSGILKGFDMEVLAYDPYPREEAAREQGFEYVGLDELYRRSDIISLHCPLTPETKHLIDAQAIRRMKRSVMIINTSRGQIIDTSDLIDALRERRVGSAGLDVYEEEEKYFFEDLSNQTLEDDKLARLLTFSNVLVTSHQGFFTEEALANIAETTLSNLTEYFRGNPLPNEICYQCNEEECRREKEGRCFVLEGDAV
jgi:D-lactate dehydrogenase